MPLKFDLTLAGPVIHGVRLDIYGELNNTNATNVDTSIYSAGTNWTENKITYNTRPAIGASPLDTQAITDNKLRLNVFDVTAYVESQIAAGKKIISFAILEPTARGTFAIFNSKEAGNATIPELIIT